MWHTPQLLSFNESLDSKYFHSKLPMYFIYEQHDIRHVMSTSLFISDVTNKLSFWDSLSVSSSVKFVCTCLLLLQLKLTKCCSVTALWTGTGAADLIGYDRNQLWHTFCLFGDTFYEARLYNTLWAHVLYLWLWLHLLITMIIQQYRCILMHEECVHSVL